MEGSFRLGDWLIQPDAGRVSRNGRTVRVRAKVMDLLVFLARHPGEVVSKDALLDGVWGTDALSESALTRSMTELRHALDDDAEQPTIIETIPKRGYRVIAPVEAVGPVPVPPHSTATPEVGGLKASVATVTMPAVSSRRLVRVLAGLVLGIATVVTIATLVVRKPPVPKVVRYLLPPPPGNTFGALPKEPQPAVSPDGRQIATVAMAQDATRRIWVHSLDSLAPRVLADTASGNFPFWSPDSRWIGFFAQGKLKKIRASGGPAEVICDAAEGLGGTWNADGTVIFAPSRTSGLYKVPASGGHPVPLTALDASRDETSHRLPQFLPDGRHYLYLVRSSRPENRGVFVGSLNSSDRRRLTDTDSNAAFVPPGYLLYVREATLMAQRFDPDSMELTGEAVPVGEGLSPASGLRFAPFSASSGVLTYRPGGMVKTRLVWADRKGQLLGEVGAPAAYLAIALSPDGSRLAADIFDPASASIDTWLLDLARNVASRFGASLSRYPVWRPDGSQLLFASNRAGPWSLYRQALNDPAQHGATPRALLQPGSDKIPQGWTPDGGSLIYLDLSHETGSDVWQFPWTGAGKPTVLLQTGFNETQVQISPDGRWMAYTSDESGRLEVYVRRFPPSAEKWQISVDGGCQPRWRADGRELFFLHAQQFMTASIEAAPSLKPGIPTRLFSVRAGRTSDLMWEYAVVPDGQRFLFKELLFEDAGSPMTVVLDWEAALTRH